MCAAVVNFFFVCSTIKKVVTVEAVPIIVLISCDSRQWIIHQIIQSRLYDIFCLFLYVFLSAIILL